MIILTAKLIGAKNKNENSFRINISLLGRGATFGEFIKINENFSRTNLLSLQVSTTYRGDNKFPSYGIISSTGNLSFIDINEKILMYANNNFLTEGQNIEVYLENTLTNTRKQVGSFISSDWDYDNNNREVSVSLKDDLEEWQDIQVEGFGYDPRNPNAILTEKSMANLYVWLQDSARTPSKYKMLSFGDLDEKTQTILSNTTIDYPLLGNSTLWGQWEKLCQVCGLYIYKNNEGKTVCSYTYGS